MPYVKMARIEQFLRVITDQALVTDLLSSNSRVFFKKKRTKCTELFYVLTSEYIKF